MRQARHPVAAAISKSVVEALAAAHKSRVVHPRLVTADTACCWKAALRAEDIGIIPRAWISEISPYSVLVASIARRRYV